MKIRNTKRLSGGFTMVEVLVALLVLLIGLSGLLGMHFSGLRATSYSRHASEASVLGEAKLEELRVEPTDTLIGAGNGTEDGVNSKGEVNSGGPYRRTWLIEDDAIQVKITVRVSWRERGAELTVLEFITQIPLTVEEP